MSDTIDICGQLYEWTEAGLVHVADDRRYLPDNFGKLVMVPFCGRIEEFQEH